MRYGVRFLLPLIVAIAVAGSGCYHLGPVSATGYRSIAVRMFRNTTLYPQLENQVSNAIIKRFQGDGGLQVRSEANADAILTGEIVKYQRLMVRSQHADTASPREYRISIDARVEVRDRVTGKQILAPTVVTGHADTFIGSDLQSSQQQALSVIADDIAKQVVSLLVEGW
jgi:hypothetical protein